MANLHHFAARHLLIIGLALVSTGCTSTLSQLVQKEDVAAERKKRHAEAIDKFEQGRDFAQFQSALGRWKSGDSDGCREALEQLLTRNPYHLDGQMLLAELLISEQEYEAAQLRLERIVLDHPENARAQHALGLALEAQENLPAAIQHYEQAAQLDPKHEVYALSLQTAQSLIK